MPTKFTFKHTALFLIQCLLSTLLIAQAPLTQQWNKRFGGSSYDELTSLQPTKDGGYILGGSSLSGIGNSKTEASRGGYDFWIVKLNAQGFKQWDKRFGGDADDKLSYIQQTTDGGYILGGSSYSGISGDKIQGSRGYSDYWVVKVDANGSKQWDKRFGGNQIDNLNTLQQTHDGGYILGGYSWSQLSGDKSENSRGNADYWVVKIDNKGLKEWDKRFGGTDYDELTSLQQTTDGGYMLGGYSYYGINGDGDKTQDGRGNSDYWTVKINANGKKEWDKRFGAVDYEHLYSLLPTIDGGYLLAGDTRAGISGDKTQPTRGKYDFWVVKLNAKGIQQWDKRYGGSDYETPTSMQQTSDGGYILGGESVSDKNGDKSQNSRGESDYWIIKIDDKGLKEWDARYGGNLNDFLFSVKETEDGGLILGGSSESGVSGDKTQKSFGLYDYWVVKLKPATKFNNLQLTAAKENNFVNLNWQNFESNTNLLNIQRSKNGIEFNTITSINKGFNDSTRYRYPDNIAGIYSKKLYYRLQTSNKNGVPAYSNIATVDVDNNALFTLSPNPAKNILYVNGRNIQQIKIINNDGKLMLNKADLNSDVNRLDISSLTNGLYLVTIIDANACLQTKTLIVQ